MCLFPIGPVGIVIYESIIRPFKIATGLEVDWASGTGGVFFVKPKGFLMPQIWNSHYFLSNLVGQFWVCGTNSRAIAGSLKDTELNKIFWRETF